jgi:hypothetical protein
LVVSSPSFHAGQAYRDLLLEQSPVQVEELLSFFGLMKKIKHNDSTLC